MFTPEDLIPVPCNPDALAMAYGLKGLAGVAGVAGVVPLTRHVPPEVLLAGASNTIVFEHAPALKEQIFRLFATNLGPEAQARCLSDLLCCLPQVAAPAGLTYRNVFRVLIMQFMDAWSFDLRAMKKSCVHIAGADGRIYPFEAYNLLYRDGQEAVLAVRRAEIARLFELDDAAG
jgi:hypothetical protein